ncbi:MAG: hypothetical protein L0H19_08055, partial [Salinisphaera sp.]|nr:hypothetical protein [Salinisphaera sp.]
AMCRAGIQSFWADNDWVFPHARTSETVSVLMLLGLCVVLTTVVDAPWHYLVATADQLHQPSHYIQAVLGSAAPVAP